MSFDTILTNSPCMYRVLDAARCIAATRVSVLITGESGTGKEIMAQAIHTASPRRNGPFITINCAALPDTLAESLLFGHRKGSFTGADQQQAGLIAAADQGTVFLDEIGELSPTLQAKLLRFLESGEILPLGETRPRRIDTRVLAATHRNLYQMTHQNAFRPDLYYRLNVVPLQLPALRDRLEDIELLALHFLACFSANHQLPPAQLEPAALQTLCRYHWPGNIRELRNTCERLSILLAGHQIRPRHLTEHLQDIRPDSQASGQQADRAIHFQLSAKGVNLDALEKDLLNQALQLTALNKTRAASLLGISRDALNYRLKKHAIT